MKQFLVRVSQIFLIFMIFSIPYLMSVTDMEQATLSWHTFMGAAGNDYGNAIAVDGSGNVYVAGTSYFTWGSPVNPHAGSADVFVAKLNSSGDLQWNTFLGTSSNDYGNAIAVDGSGNVYVAGYSEDAGSYMLWGDAFAVKLNSSGVLQWNTFMGTFDVLDYGNAIAVDGSGNVYVAGYSDGTWGSPVNAFAGSREAFAAKLNISGTLQWNTFMGSSLYVDSGCAIAVDGSGNVYVAGESGNTWGSPVNAHAGPADNISDGFAAKLDNSGTRVWHTFMGGADWDYSNAIAADDSGYVYVAGESEATWGSPVIAFGGNIDAFAAKLSSSGSRLWHTFMGSSDIYYDLFATDSLYGVQVDGSGNVYVCGEFWGSWGSPENGYAGNGDALAAMLDSSGNLQWHTFMGSSITDSAAGISLGGSGDLYIGGFSNATWGSPVNAHAGGRDAFAAKLTTGAAQAEIHVRFGGIDFGDGSTRNLGTRTSSFIMGREFTFTIENQGTGSLNLTGSPEVTLSGPQAAHFYISQQPTSPVAPLGSTIFKLRTVRDSLPGFLPIGWSYSVSITVNIPNDDADENPYDFTLNFTLEKDS
jgi:hypothetical protein